MGYELGSKFSNLLQIHHGIQKKKSMFLVVFSRSNNIIKINTLLHFVSARQDARVMFSDVRSVNFAQNHRKSTFAAELLNKLAS